MPESTTDLEALVEVAVLEGITFFGVSANRSDQGAQTPAPGQASDILPIHSLEVVLRHNDGGFSARFRTNIDVHIGTVATDVNIEYATRELPASSIPQDVLLSFVNNVALMVVFPYIRQAVADITQRVFGSTLLLPMIQRGEIDFSAAGVPADAS